MDDLERIKKAGKSRVDVTVGSALDIFGGDLPYKDVVLWHRKQSMVGQVWRNTRYWSVLPVHLIQASAQSIFSEHFCSNNSVRLSPTDPLSHLLFQTILRPLFYTTLETVFSDVIQIWGAWLVWVWTPGLALTQKVVNLWVMYCSWQFLTSICLL